MSQYGLGGGPLQGWGGGLQDKTNPKENNKNITRTALNVSWKDHMNMTNTELASDVLLWEPTQDK